MSAVKALALARECGVRVFVSGTDLILEAVREPEPIVLRAIERNKSEILALFGTQSDEWTAEDWKAFYDERAGIAEFESGNCRQQAETGAYECSICEWLRRNPEPSEPDRCAWCNKPESGGATISPFLASDTVHTWLHSECWERWHDARKAKAKQSLAAMGIYRGVEGK